MAVDSSANIGIRVFLDDAASRGLYAINTTLGQIGTQAKMAGAGFKQAGDSLVGFGVVAGLAASFALFAGAIALSVTNAVKFQTILIQMARAGNLTDAQMQALGQTLMAIGGRSIFSIEELGQAFVVLLQRGISAQQIMNGVGQAAVYLAEATGMSATQGAQLLASTLVSFNIPASQAAQTADLLQFAIEHGIGPSDALAGSIARLGAIAATLHLSLADVVPAMDVLTRATGSYSTATTALYYYLNQIKYGTATYRDEIQKLGLSFYDAQGDFVGLDASLSMLYAKLKDKTPQEAAQILGTLFNIRSSQGISILMQDLAQVNGLAKQLIVTHNNLDTAMNRAKQAEDSAAGAWHGFTTNMQDVLTLMGGPFLAIIQPVLLHLRDLASSLRQFASQNPTVMAAFVALGAAISLVGLIIVATMSPIGIFILVMAGVVVGVMALAAIIETAVGHWRQIQGVLAAVAPIARAVGVALLVVGGIIAGIALAPWVVALTQAALALTYLGIAALTRAVPAMLAYGAQLLQLIAKTVAYAVVNAGTLIPMILRTAAAWVVETLATMAALLPYILIAAVIAAAVVGLGLLIAKLGLLNVIVNIAKAAWNAILPALQSVAAMLKDAIVAAIKQLQPVWQQLVAAFNAAKPALLFLGAVLGIILVAAFAVIMGVIRAAIVVIGTLLATVIRVAAGIFQAIAGIVQFFLGFFKLLQGIFTGNTKIIQEGWNMMMQGLKNIVTGIGSAILGAFTGLWNAVIGGIRNFVAGVINFFKGLWNSLVGHSIVWDIVNGTIGAFASMPGRVIGIVAGWIGQLLSLVGSLVGRMISALNIGNFVGVFARLPGQIIGALGNLAGDLWNFGAHIIQMFIGGIESAVGGLLSTIGNIAGQVASFLHFSGTPERGPLHEADQWMPHMMEMLASTAQTHMPIVAKMGSNIAQGIAASGSAIHPAIAGTTAGTGTSPTQFIINLDGKVIYNNTMTRMRNGLQAQGTARLLR